MRINIRAVGTAVATAAVFAVAAGPAAAAGGPSLAKAMHDVHAAKSSLKQVSKFASSNPAAARRALVRSRSEIAAAAHQARWLHARGKMTASATAFEGVAGGYNLQVNTDTSLLGSTSGSLQMSLAQSIVPALTGQIDALGFLGQLTSLLPVSSVGTATNTITGVLANGPAELSSLTSLVGTLPAQIQAIVAQAITASGSMFDAGIAEVEGLVPSLPSPALPTVQSLLSTLMSSLTSIESTFTGAQGSIGGLFGGTIGTQLSQVTSILQGLLGNLGNLSNLGGLGNLGGTLTGTGTVSATGTAGTGLGGLGGLGGILGGLPGGLGSILSGLLGNFGITLPTL